MQVCTESACCQIHGHLHEIVRCVLDTTRFPPRATTQLSCYSGAICSVAILLTCYCVSLLKWCLFSR